MSHLDIPLRYPSGHTLAGIFTFPESVSVCGKFVAKCKYKGVSDGQDKIAVISQPEIIADWLVNVWLNALLGSMFV
ncbi:hypothetical protein CEXT_573641 [Caerostris extrusa]|uniref:Uncharacterized protein n=1 Tax=Caerostris extrusa TaxID=172846 RepID=A0AAV4S9U8_CAEEX|nr:hypothetical protein CEXT_573641 [Caerostris extrusa]